VAAIDRMRCRASAAVPRRAWHGMSAVWPAQLQATLAVLLAGAVSATLAQPATAPPPAPPGTTAPPAPPGAALARAPATEEAPFVLSEIRLPRTLALPEQEVFGVVAPFLRRAIGNEQLAEIAKRIRDLYDSRGYGLVGVGLAMQDMASGSLEVSIVEPRIGRVQIDSGAEPPISDARTRRLLDELGLRDGEPLNLQRLDRAMFTLNDWPGVSARATIVPTGDEGQFNLVLVVERGRAYNASIDYDNHGSASSGRHRLGALLRWNNPLGVGDNLDVRALVSNARRVTVGRVSYELPVGATPWRAGVGYSRVTYELGGSFQALGAVGSADVVDASVSYPLVRARDRNVALRAALETKRLEDRFDAFGVQSNKRIDGLQLGLSFEARDALWGGGFNGGSVGLQVGRLRIATADVNANDAALGDRATQGGFTKVSAQVTRLQAITTTVSTYFGVAGQWASKNLDNAEKLTLGGAKGVRSYPGGEAPSDQGLIVNAELRWWIDPAWSAFGFYDWGIGGLQKRASPGTDNRRILRGVGLGVQFSNPELLAFKASLGWRGSEPVLSETGDSRVRLLLQAQRPF
jgi:hemolysin activation/secretion protein